MRLSSKHNIGKQNGSSETTHVLKTQQKLKVPGFMTIESNVSIDDNNC